MFPPGETSQRGKLYFGMKPKTGKTFCQEQVLHTVPEEMGAQEQVRAGLASVGRQSTVLPGGLTQLLVYSLRTVPRWGKVQIMKLVLGGISKHQRQPADAPSQHKAPAVPPSEVH